jgi:hypothetical protein
MDDLDQKVRLAAFKWLEEQVRIHGDVLPRSILSEGFEVENQRVPLIGPQGIFKPKVLTQIPLSITTEPHGPYVTALVLTACSCTVTGERTRSIETMQVFAWLFSESRHLCTSTESSPASISQCGLFSLWATILINLHSKSQWTICHMLAPIGRLDLKEVTCLSLPPRDAWRTYNSSEAAPASARVSRDKPLQLIGGERLIKRR